MYSVNLEFERKFGGIKFLRSASSAYGCTKNLHFWSVVIHVFLFDENWKTLMVKDQQREKNADCFYYPFHFALRLPDVMQGFLQLAGFALIPRYKSMTHIL